MTHLRKVDPRVIPYPGHRFRDGFGNIRERRMRIGVHGHAVEKTHAELGHPCGNLCHVVIVYAGDDDGIHFYDNAPRPETHDGFELASEQELGRFESAINDLPVMNPTVDHLSNNRINCVYGYGCMRDPKIGKNIHIRPDTHPVACYAKEHFREPRSYEPHGFQ